MVDCLVPWDSVRSFATPSMEIGLPMHEVFEDLGKSGMQRVGETGYGDLKAGNPVIVPRP